MYAFDYHRPTTVRDAQGLLKDGARPLAGGQTLIPTLKQRLANPPVVVDLGAIAELRGIEQSGGALVIGAMTRHAEVAEFESRAGCFAGAGRACGKHRRSARAQQRHHRGLGREQRSSRRLSSCCAGPRRDHRHQQAADRCRSVLQGAVHDSAGRGRDHHPAVLPAGGEVCLRQISQSGVALCAGRCWRLRSVERRCVLLQRAQVRPASSVCRRWRRRWPRPLRPAPSTASRSIRLGS